MTSRIFTPSKRADHAVHYDRHHGFALARSAKHDPAFTLATRHCFRCRADEKRVVDWFLAEGAEVFHLVPERAEQLFHLLLVLKTGVVCAERNFHETRITLIATNFITLESIRFSQFVWVPEIRVSIGKRCYPPCSFASSRQISRSRSVIFFGTLT